jgi:hypothetical protein
MPPGCGSQRQAVVREIVGCSRTRFPVANIGSVEGRIDRPDEVQEHRQRPARGRLLPTLGVIELGAAVVARVDASPVRGRGVYGHGLLRQRARFYAQSAKQGQHCSTPSRSTDRSSLPSPMSHLDPPNIMTRMSGEHARTMFRGSPPSRLEGSMLPPGCRAPLRDRCMTGVSPSAHSFGEPGPGGGEPRLVPALSVNV